MLEHKRKEENKLATQCTRYLFMIQSASVPTSKCATYTDFSPVLHHTHTH